MTAAWFQFRVALRERGRVWIAIGLLAGLAAGIVMTAVAGARRTDSSLRRVVVDQRAPDVLVNPNNGSLTDAQWRRIEQIPQVARYAQLLAAPMVPILANGKPDINFVESARGNLVFENRDGFELHDIDRAGVVSGRIPKPSETDALVINELAASTRNLRVGSKFRVGFFDVRAMEGSPGTIPKLQPRTLTVVGIVRTLDDSTRTLDDPRMTPTYLLSGSLSRSIANLGYMFGGLEVRLHDHGQVAEYEQQVRDVTGANVLDFQELGGTLERAHRATHPYVLALWLFSLLAALAGGAVVFQISTREYSVESRSRSVLRALGLTRRDFARTGALRGLFVAAVATIVAGGVMIVGSLLMPIGPLRVLEPNPGVDVDFAVLVIGVLVVAVGSTAYSTLSATRRAAPARARSPRVADALAGQGASPAVLTGIRFALDPGRGDAATPVRSTVFGVALAVGALVATLVFAGSLTHFTSTPRMYGWAWTYQIEPSGGVPPATLERSVTTLARDPLVRGAAVGAYAQLTISGKTIGGIAVESGRGVPVAEMVSGREPRLRSEIALGAQTLRSLGRHEGDTVDVKIGAVTKPFTVVGQAVFARFAPYPASEPTGLGVGAAMTLDGLQQFGPLDGSERSPLAGSPFALVDAAPAATAAHFESVALHDDPSAGMVLPAQRPNYVVSYQHLERTPLVLAGLLVALAIATTIHLLVSVLRRRRRDFGVLRSLGFTSSQLRTTILVHAATLIALSLAVAIPLGVIAGRLLWSATSRWLGIPVHGVVPLAAIAFVGLSAFAVGLGVALVPAAAVARLDPAEILRSE